MQGDTHRILYLCSGPDGRSDGFDAWASRAARALGCEAPVEMWDARLYPTLDLAGDTIFETLLARARANSCSAVLASPPCSTFSVGRKGSDGGPVRLRGPAPPELYGLKGIKGQDKGRVRLGTLLALRCAQLCQVLEVAL